MTTYSPAGFGVTSRIGPHQGLRVTFAQTRSAFTPDMVEEADFRDNLTHLVDALGAGGYTLAPASDVTVAPGELAATIDFLVMGPMTAAQAASQLQDALYGPLDFSRRTYIRDVALLNSGDWGDPIPPPIPDTETNPLAWLAGTTGVVLGVVALVFFAPEIKTAIWTKQHARKGT